MQTKRTLKWGAGLAGGAVVLFAAPLALSLLFPRIETSLLFGADAGPLDLAVKESFAPREADEKTSAIVAAAEAFLNSLSAGHRETATFALSDNVQRANWSNFPEGMVPRSGLMMRELSDEQRSLLDALMAEFMSERGMLNLEYQLIAEDTFPTGTEMLYGTGYYYVAFLGEPSTSQPWMFMFGGHHLAINVTVYGPDLTFSPMLTGGQPLHIRYDGGDLFVTEEETAAAQALLDSLTDEQEAIAVRSEEAIDLLLGPGEYGTIVAPEGIKGSDLTDEQKQLLVELIDTRLGFINDDDNAATMAAVLAELDDTYFGWWGPRGRLGFAYFRVTGPSLVLEYAPQDDVGATVTDHAHSMYRDPENDYGEAWIAEGN